MKWLSAGLAFVNAATVYGLLLGMIGHGLNKTTAVCAVLAAGVVAVFAYRQTQRATAPADDVPEKGNAINRSLWRYRSVWLWLAVAVFAIFALRSFCWLIFLDGNEIKVQSPNNLGDLSLHLAYIKNFANGVSLWPDNPIYISSHTRYPAGTDLFNGLLVLLGLDVTRGLVWTGLLASAATCYALYRWAGSFGIAAFLFNGGLVSLIPFFAHDFSFQDFQGDKTIAWKSIPLALFVTQRGWLYALPVGLLLLCHWRDKYLRSEQRTAISQQPKTVEEKEGDLEMAAPRKRPVLPFWLELAFYATMPLFHLHTFIALSIVLACLFLFGNWNARTQLALRVGGALVPATFLVWLITDQFHASSVMQWHPGWVNRSGSDMAMPFPYFWLMNFGAWVPLIIFFLGITAWGIGNAWSAPDFKLPPGIAFVAGAIGIFLLGYLVKMAPWEWDNIKIIVWAYFIILPFLWKDLVAHWPMALRAAVCVVLFASGFISLFGGLEANKVGFGLADRAELDVVGMAVRKLPPEARFAAFPTYNHPLLLQGRKVVLGYPGHLWTQGFDYGPTFDKLRTLMEGAADWKQTARSLQARYLFWGREEKINYPLSKRPWEHASKLIAAGSWGAIYDLESPSQETSPPRSDQSP
ncbi:MAG: hypothetical protein QOD12_794 [Verrucomicrobiota bacterium]|jgi:hypothetical protein